MSKVGRPLKFKTIEELEQLISDYHTHLKNNLDEIPDIEGLAYFLDTTRKTLLDYENKPEFSYTIKKAKDFIAFKKKQLALKGKIPTGTFCFDFKNNHGYKDQQEIKHDGGFNIIVQDGT